MPDKSQSYLLAGAVMGVAGALLGLIPRVGSCLACVLYLGVGLLAVWHYTDRHQLTIAGGQGAGLGAMAGLVAGVVGTVLQYLFQVIGLAPDWREAMQAQFDQSGMDPAQAEELLETFSSPLIMVGILLAIIVIDVIIGAVGGAIGASVFKRGPGFVEESGESTRL